MPQTRFKIKSFNKEHYFPFYSLSYDSSKLNLSALTNSSITKQKTRKLIVEKRKRKYKSTIYYIISIFTQFFFVTLPLYGVQKKGNILKNTMIAHFCLLCSFQPRFPLYSCLSYSVPKMADSHGLYHWVPLLASFLIAEYWRLAEEETLGISSPTPSSSVLILWQQPQPSHQTALPL